MTSPFLGELLGTMTLILLGDSVVAGALLDKSKGKAMSWVGITASWCFSTIAGIFVATATGSADAHINPARDLGPRIAHAVLPIAGKGRTGATPRFQ